MRGAAMMLAAGASPVRLISAASDQASYVPATRGAIVRDMALILNGGAGTGLSAVIATPSFLTAPLTSEYVFGLAVLRDAQALGPRRGGGRPAGNSTIPGFVRHPAHAGLVIVTEVDPRSIVAGPNLSIAGVASIPIILRYYRPPDAENIGCNLHVVLDPEAYRDGTPIEVSSPTGTYGGSIVHIYEILGAV